MSETMIERIDAAIREKLMEFFGIIVFNDFEFELARAAIEAMREPTIEMVSAGVDDIMTGPGISSYTSWAALVADRHRKMIDAALSQSLHSLPSEDR